MPKEFQTYEIGEVCVVCLTDRKDKDKPPCWSWGKYFLRHTWNKARLRIEVQRIPETKCK